MYEAGGCLNRKPPAFLSVSLPGYVPSTFVSRYVFPAFLCCVSRVMPTALAVACLAAPNSPHFHTGQFLGHACGILGLCRFVFTASPCRLCVLYKISGLFFSAFPCNFIFPASPYRAIFGSCLQHWVVGLAAPNSPHFHTGQFLGHACGILGLCCFVFTASPCRLCVLYKISGLVFPSFYALFVRLMPAAFWVRMKSICGPQYLTWLCFSPASPCRGMFFPRNSGKID